MASSLSEATGIRDETERTTTPLTVRGFNYGWIVIILSVTFWKNIYFVPFKYQ